MQAAQSSQRIGKEHESQPAHHRVEAGGLHLQILAVRDMGLDVVKAGQPGIFLGQRQDGRRQIRGEYATSRAYALRDVQCLIAGPGGHIQHTCADTDASHVQHGVGSLAQPGADLGSVLVPALR